MSLVNNKGECAHRKISSPFFQTNLASVLFKNKKYFCFSISALEWIQTGGNILSGNKLEPVIFPLDNCFLKKKSGNNRNLFNVCTVEPFQHLKINFFTHLFSLGDTFLFFTCVYMHKQLPVVTRTGEGNTIPAFFFVFSHWQGAKRLPFSYLHKKSSAFSPLQYVAYACG